MGIWWAAIAWFQAAGQSPPTNLPLSTEIHLSTKSSQYWILEISISARKESQSIATSNRLWWFIVVVTIKDGDPKPVVYVPNHCPQTAQQFIEAQRWAIQQPQLDVERICSMPTVCGYYFLALKWAQSQLVRPSRPQIHLAISTAIAMIPCQPQCGSHQNAAGNKMPHRMPHGKDRVAIALGCREALADFLWQDQWWDPWPLDARPGVPMLTSNVPCPIRMLSHLLVIFLADWRAWHFLATLHLGKSETLSARTSLNCAVARWEEHLPGQGTSPCLFFSVRAIHHFEFVQKSSL